MANKVNIGEANHHELKVYCANKDYKMQTFLQEAIKEKMEREPLE